MKTKMNMFDSAKIYGKIVSEIREKYNIPVGPIRGSGISEAVKLEDEAWRKYILPYDRGY